MKYNGRDLRHEIKYLINKSDYEQLKSRLGHVIGLDQNAKKESFYHIRSLYFDNMYQSAYYEKEDGVFQRKKYRIRIYNYSDKQIRLELKEKFDRYISKESTLISKELYFKIVDGKLAHEDTIGNDLLMKFYIETKMNGLKPRIIIDYNREPFVYKHGNVRITFDRQLKMVLNGKDIFSKELGLYSILGDNEMILEIKYDDYLPQFIDSTVQLFHHQLVSASKYVMCCEADLTLNWKESI